MVSAMWLPTRPLTLIDAINRKAAAQGSMRYAAACADANYNGHRVSVAFNDYRRYWVTEYFWAGRVVLARGELAACLRVAKDEYDRGARGCEVHAYVRDEAERAIAEGFGFLPFDEEIKKTHAASYMDPRWEKLHEAFEFEKWGLGPCVGYLANSKTVEEYEAKKEAWKAEHKNAKPRIPAGPRLEDVL